MCFARTCILVKKNILLFLTYNGFFIMKIKYWLWEQAQLMMYPIFRHSLKKSMLIWKF
jgi:hypothetical protein